MRDRRGLRRKSGIPAWETIGCVLTVTADEDRKVKEETERHGERVEGVTEVMGVESYGLSSGT